MKISKKPSNLPVPVLALLGLMGLLSLGLTTYSAWRLFGVGTLSWHIVQPETAELFVELIFVFCLLFFALERKNPWLRLCLLLVLLAVSCWVHIVFLPMAAAAVYLCFLYYLGKWQRLHLFGRKHALLQKNTEKTVFADALLGAVSVILLFCLLSAFHIGGAKKQVLALMGIGIPLLVWVLWDAHKRKQEMIQCVSRWTINREEAFVFAAVITLFLLQAGRMNLTVDYDSLWYGLRSEYILDNGRGIYENLGTLGVVYTYSKAMEILLLPFNSLPSHAFVLAFGVYFTAAGIFAFYMTARQWMSARFSRLAVLLLSTVPAVMNMSVSAKTDAATLAVQLILFYYLSCYWKEQKTSDLVLAFCALLFSFTLKPTSIVFSSAVFGMSILYFLYCKRLRLSIQLHDVGLIGVFLAELAAVCLRTWILTGVPITSVYTALFQKLGFSIRYPFEIPEQIDEEILRTVSLSFAEKWDRFLGRLYGVFLCPEEKVDMAHVIFAWGGLLFLFFLILGVLWLILRRWGQFSKTANEPHKEKRRLRQPSDGWYLAWILIPLSVGSLYILFDLSQIDGNYYNFVYALALFAGCFGISRVWQPDIRRAFVMFLFPAAVMGVTMSAVTNWAWQIGLTPVTVKNCGFFNHEKQEYDTWFAADGMDHGNEAIWAILAQNPRYRVIAVGSHPDTLLFPCSVQSYGDIAGSWGNPSVVESVDKFCTFAKYAKTDYVYIQSYYMCRWEDPYPFLCKLIYHGVLTDLVFEYGNVLAKVNPDGVHDEKADAQLAQFLSDDGCGYYPSDMPVRLK
ncbi:MAG: glycosyltransferase family 39 protein [bacterium]|nr:glycosyltransferase family 39 protein [bacterium]